MIGDPQAVLERGTSQNYLLFVGLIKYLQANKCV